MDGELQRPSAAERHKLKDLGRFDVEPEFAYLWDRCVYDLLYNPEIFVENFCELLRQHGINKDSNILDTCAGSGFPALDMYNLGYQNISCVDGSPDQIELFNSKAETRGLAIRSEQYLWEELPTHFKPEQFEVLICKGSIWYAGGAWNKEGEPNREASLKALKDTLATFFSLLVPGGILYLDKFKDKEVDHRDVVGTFEVQGTRKELIFNTHREKELDIRRAQMTVKDVATGLEAGLPNVTYDLKEEELEQALEEVGFSILEPDMPEEKFFKVWLAVKK